MVRRAEGLRRGYRPSLRVQPMYAYIVPLLVYWLAFFVTCERLTALFQDQLYDEVTPYAGLKAAGGSLVLALLATWLHPSFETLFTDNLAWTMLQALAWVGVFILVLRFHPWHGLAIALVAMLLVPGLTTLGVDNIMTPSKTLAPIKARGAPPVRKALNSTDVPGQKAEPATK